MDREGLRDLFPSLAGAQSVRDVVDLIAHEVAAKPPGEWLVTAPLGTPPYHFDVAEMLAENRVPTRWDLDGVARRIRSISRRYGDIGAGRRWSAC